MPTYQYACTACGHQLEAVQSFSEDALTECPACEGRLRKLFGSVGIVFKGPGFYRTDSRAAANGNGASKNGKSGEDSSGDRKPDTSGTEKKDSPASSGKDSGSGDSGSKGSGSKDSGSKDKAPATTST